MDKNKSISDITSLLFWLEREGWEVCAANLDISGDGIDGSEPYAEIVIKYRPKEEAENDNKN